MKEFPTIPAVSAVPADVFEQGHLWLYEYIAGVQFRFQLTGSGILRIGDDRRIYEPDGIPPLASTRGSTRSQPTRS